MRVIEGALQRPRAHASRGKATGSAQQVAWLRVLCSGFLRFSFLVSCQVLVPSTRPSLDCHGFRLKPHPEPDILCSLSSLRYQYMQSSLTAQRSSLKTKLPQAQHLTTAFSGCSSVRAAALLLHPLQKPYSGPEGKR